MNKKMVTNKRSKNNKTARNTNRKLEKNEYTSTLCMHAFKIRMPH